ncbi:MAG TPA: type II CAAX endopeptidase family protein, partial [Luteimonas sp.]|nr:type II CAAX endopeptidase family protein [Luteimonas sp.]
MRKFLSDCLFDAAGRLRNGWWALIFLASVFVTTRVYTPLSHGLQALGVAKDWLHPLPVAFVLIATWICTRLRREPLSSVGLRMDRRWAREFAWGCAIGLGGILLATGLIAAIGGVRFELDPARSVGTLAFGLYMFTFVALLEELMFRGFLFQRLVAGIGVWPAQILLAALFAFAHWGNPGMEGAAKVWATIDIALAAITLGLAYLRTRSLALPVGLHLSWNWAQGHLLGFGVSGIDLTGWLHPVFQGKPTWITGGDFGPEASLMGVIADLAMLAVIWKWAGKKPNVDEVECAIDSTPAQPSEIA